MRENLESKAFEYASSLFAPEDKLLQDIQKEAQSLDLGGMSLNSVEAKLLSLLIQLRGVKKVVEVGTFLGYSALCMARALPEDGELYTLEKDPSRAEQARQFLDRDTCGSQVKIFTGEALSQLDSLEDQGPFDMIFIDANKGGYVDYLNWAEKNIRPGGLIVGDNTFLFGAVYGESRNHKMGEKTIETMREFNRRLSCPDKYESLLLPTQEGMTIAIKKF